MEEFPKDFEIPVPWGKICGKWWGPECNEPILFLHGWQDNLGSFDRLIPLLPKGLPYVSIDFPGHGQSSPYPKGTFYYLFWDGLLVVRRIVKQMGWSKISIVGHSMGGAIGFMYAGTFPDQIDKLICLDIACPRVSNPSTILNRLPDCVDKFLEYENLNENKQPCYKYDEMHGIAFDGYGGSVTRQSVDILLKRGVRPSVTKPDKLVFTRDVRLKVALLGMLSLDIALEFASKIKCHYMNLRASKGIQFESPEIYDQVLDQIKLNAKSFKYFELPGTHHFHLNNAEDLVPYLSDFLTTSPGTNGHC